MADRPPVPPVDRDAFDRNQRRFNPVQHVDHCYLCGRGLTPSALDRGWWIEIDSSGCLLGKRRT